jgi:very-short-patch-repair endonuclease
MPQKVADALLERQAQEQEPYKISIGGLATRVLALCGGERLTLIGIDRDGVGDALRARPEGGRSALLLECGTLNAEAILDDLIDDLADLAFARFPHWYGRGEMGLDELIAFANSDPHVSAPWLRAAAKRAAAGYVPRFRRTAKQFEFAQLMRAVDSRNPVLIAEIDTVAPERAAPVIAALDWCLGQDASVVVALAARPPAIAPYDRVLYGALDVVRDVTPAEARFIVSRSRAHHASAIEQRLEATLRRDPELGPLFSCNEVVPIEGFGLQPRVDLLWREGCVVVELDGPEHQADPNFANDRHRDYELLVSGYLVLRITNDQAETDLQHAIERIRAVVRFRRTMGLNYR